MSIFNEFQAPEVVLLLKCDVNHSIGTMLLVCISENPLQNVAQFLETMCTLMFTKVNDSKNNIPRWNSKLVSVFDVIISNLQPRPVCEYQHFDYELFTSKPIVIYNVSS